MTDHPGNKGGQWHRDAYWYAVGWNDARTSDPCDPVDFASYVRNRVDEHELGRTHWLPSIPAMFVEWVRILPAAVREKLSR